LSRKKKYFRCGCVIGNSNKYFLTAVITTPETTTLLPITEKEFKWTSRKTYWRKKQKIQSNVLTNATKREFKVNLMDSQCIIPLHIDSLPTLANSYFVAKIIADCPANVRKTRQVANMRSDPSGTLKTPNPRASVKFSSVPHKEKATVVIV